MIFPFPDMSLCDISLCLLSEFYYLIVSIQTCLYRWMESESDDSSEDGEFFFKIDSKWS